MLNLRELNDINKLMHINSNKNNERYRIPIKNEEIYFIEDVWTFKNSNNESEGKVPYNFNKIPISFRNIVKLMILEWIVNHKRFSTIDKYFVILKNITNFLYDNGVVQCEYIPHTNIEAYCKYIRNNLKSENEIIKRRKIFIKLLKHLEYNYKMEYQKGIKLLNDYSTDLLMIEIEENKTPTIPQIVFKRIIKYALNEMENEYAKTEYRIQAAIVALLSQIGIRIGDITLIEFDKIRFTECFNETVQIPHLEYRTFKGSRKGEGKWTKTFLTDEALIAYNTLVKLSKYKDSKYIISKNGMKKDSETTRKLIYKFIVRNSKLIGLVDKEYEELEKITIESLKEKYFISRLDNEKFKDAEYISMVKPHQFRVAVCNDLLRQGVDIAWVAQQMDHLLPETTDYYVRNENKEKEFAKSIIKQIIKHEYKLIGENADELVENINEFINKDVIKVYKTIDDAIDDLVEKMPIREKKEGFCIKSSFGKKCKYNEFLCAFEECPNHFTAFIFADISFCRYNDLAKVIKYNEDNGFVNQAKVERDKLAKFIKCRFIKELRELKIEISSKGIENIVSKYPKLEYICKNVDIIIKEVEVWI